jgi:hypothetical protein
MIRWMHRRLSFVIAAWVIAVLSASGAVLAYKGTPGDEGTPAPRWPEGSTLVRDTERPTLVMFIHPECPCTRASVEELARIVGRGDVSVRTIVAVVRPAGADLPEKSGVVERARQLPGVEVVVDQGGVEGVRFGAETSGHTLLFAADGRRVFSGGVTASRGHQGESEGGALLLALLRGRRTESAFASIFGCNFSTAEERRETP